MSPFRRLTAAGAALALSLSWAVTAAVPASAQAQPPPPRKAVFSAPKDGDLITSPTQTIEVFIPFEVAELLTQQTPELTLTTASGEPVRKPETITVNETCQKVVFSDVPLDLNGKYEATITVPGSRNPIGVPVNNQNCNDPKEKHELFVGVRPAAPTGVKAEVKQPLDPATVSWNRALERDVVRYRVLRAKGGDGRFEPVGEAPATRTSFTDPASATGGEFLYRIVAIRRGSGKAGQPEFLESDPSAPSDKVTVAPPLPRTAPAAGPVRRSTRPAPAPRPRYITPGETGFSETLPFAGGPQLAEESGDVVGDSREVQELGADDSRSDSPRSLALLAAGLLATVLAMHLLWVKAEVDREPLEVLPPD